MPLPRHEQSHARIVDAAARALRRNGFAGVGVADVMREAGPTRGGFYAHFEARDALLIAAMAHAESTSVASIAARLRGLRPVGGSAFRALVESYLSDHLLVHLEAGCPVAALCAEMRGSRRRCDWQRASASMR